jgi:hypothetical protein
MTPLLPPMSLSTALLRAQERDPLFWTHLGVILAPLFERRMEGIVALGARIRARDEALGIVGRAEPKVRSMRIPMKVTP